MIYVIDSSNLKEYGDLYRDQFRLRYQEFIERQRYDVKVYNRMEFDEYDTPASTYLVYADRHGKALGVSRLIPTTVSCMLVEQWPHMLYSPNDVVSPCTWEGTRFCVDSQLSPPVRRKISHELCASYLEYGLSHGIERIIGLMHTFVLRSIFGKCGIHYTALGDVSQIGKHAKVQAAEMAITITQLANLRKITGLDRVIENNFKANEEGEYKYAA